MIESFSGYDSKRKEGASLDAESTYVRYGQENVSEEFIRIASIDDEKKRRIEIDKFIQKMEQNSEKNSFFKRDERIPILLGLMGQSGMSPAIKIDDMDIYYGFFENFHRLYEKHKGKYPTGAIHGSAIRYFIDDYLGYFNGDVNKRESLVAPIINDDGSDNFKLEVASIKGLKNQGCAMCVERASVSHNLWLLGGYESTYVSSGTVEFTDSMDEGHAYCLIKADSGYLLFDTARGVPNILIPFSENPREDILSGKPFEVEIDGVKQIYANNDMIQKRELGTTKDKS